MNAPRSSRAKGNVLIVDDTADNLRLLSTLLTQQGYYVRGAISGSAALMAVEAAPPDVVLLDINMPKMNGYEVCQRLKENENTRHIPVIFLSAMSEVLDKVAAFRVGGVDYITKPFHVEEVMARIETQLNLHRMQLMLEAKNHQLQQEVYERTQVEAALRESEAQLRQQTEQLTQTLRELQRAQAQLIQSEKMSSLGQLVAGVAHEINNPINFIHGNLSPAKIYAQNLLELIDLYEAHLPNGSPSIQAHSEEMDLDFVKQDLPRLLVSMQVGTDRIRDIVRSLRNFSRLDEAEMKAVNLHDGLDSTLLILGDRFKPKAQFPGVQVIKSYGDLPLVECYAGQLNQVFMNILSNALDAVEEHYHNSDPPNTPILGQIEIRTEVTDRQQARIVILDNGAGMDETVQQRLFDPFFTTKPIGKGTGMGMAISYQIVTEKHQGSLTCRSRPEGGSAFVIEIPLHQTVPEEPVLTHKPG